jgi:hypothetical protein
VRAKGLIPVLVVIAMLVFASIIAFARGAPNGQIHAQATVTVEAPVVANVVPVMNGFDVIQNVTAYSRLASVKEITDTSDATGLSTTGDERGLTSGFYLARSGPHPDTVLLA